MFILPLYIPYHIWLLILETYFYIPQQVILAGWQN